MTKIGSLKPGAIARERHAIRNVLGGLGVVAWILSLAACDPLSLTMFGVGTATGVQHTLNGIISSIKMES